MNANDLNSNELANQCVAYLLDEMSPNEAAEFETRLSDPSVAHRLELESTLLVGLANSTPPSPALSPLPAFRTRSRHLMVLASLAAAFFAIVTTWNLFREDGAEELRIAQAWAARATLESNETLAPIEIVETEFSFAPFDEISSEPGLADSVDWMVVAVQVGSEEASSGGLSDG